MKRSAVIMGLGMLALLSPQLDAYFQQREVDTSCVRLVGRWPEGPPTAIAATDHLLIAGIGSSLRIFLPHQNGLPVELGGIVLPRPAAAVSTVGNTALVALESGGLLTVDIEVPQQPRILGNLAYTSEDNTTLAQGNGFVIVRTDTGFAVIDVTNREAPFIRGSMPLQAKRLMTSLSQGVWRGVTLDEDPESRECRLAILDLSDPLAATETGNLEFFRCDEETLATSGDLVAFTSWPPLLHVVDISNPASPVQLGDASLPADTTSIALSGRRVFTAGDDPSLALFHVTPEREVVEDWTGEQPSGTPGAQQLVVGGGYLYYWQPDKPDLAVLDVSHGVIPKLLGVVQTPGRSRAVTVQNDIAYVATEDGVQLVKLGETSLLSRIGSVRVPGGTQTTLNRIAVRGTQGAAAEYVGNGYGKVFLVDLSASDRPAVTNQFEDRDLTDIALRPDCILVSSVLGWVNAYGLGGPVPPEQISHFKLPSAGAWANALLVQGDTVIVAGLSRDRDPSNLWAIDFSHPESPFLIGETTIENAEGHSATLKGLAAHDGLAWTAGGVIEGLDFSNPAHPVSQMRWAGSPWDGMQYGPSFAVLPQHLAGADWYRNLWVVDMTQRDAPKLALLASIPGGVSDATSWHDLVVTAAGSAGLSVYDVSSCRPELPQADFTYEPATPILGQRIHFHDQSRGLVAERAWSFRDYTGAAVTEPDPIRELPTGPNLVRLQVGNDLGQSTKWRQVFVDYPHDKLSPLSLDAPYTTIVPAVAHARGLAGTAWITDLSLVSASLRGYSSDTVTAHLLDGGGASSARTCGFPFPDVEEIPDVVSTSFHEESTTGALLLQSMYPIAAISRVYDATEEGTFGQLVGSVRLEDATPGSSAAELLQLTSGADFRSNVGIVNLSSQEADYTIAVRRADGRSVGNHHVRIPGMGWTQVSDLIGTLSGGAPIEDAIAEVTSSRGDGRFVAYASVVDNRSGDGTFFPSSSKASTSYLIPAVASTDGLFGSRWQSDVEIYNPGVARIHVRFDLIPEPGGARATSSAFELPPGTARRFKDLLRSVFGQSGKGAVLIASDDGPFLASSRTYSSDGHLSFGQLVPAVAAEDVLTYGSSWFLPQLRGTHYGIESFRTNLGVVNLGDTELIINVKIQARLSEGYSGLKTRDLDVTVPAGSYRQIGDLLEGLDLVSPAHARVLTRDRSARFYVYASVIDNRTNDPVFIPPVWQDPWVVR